MIMLSIDDESGHVFASINGNEAELSSLLAYAVLRDNGFKKIFTLAREAIKIKEQENNK